MTEDPILRERIAYHEAGHAVACYLQEIPFRYVSIIPTRRNLGKLKASQLPSFVWVNLGKGEHLVPEASLSLDHHMIMRLAGPMAEILIYGDMLDQEGKGDIATVAELYPDEEIVRYYCDRAKEMLEPYRHYLEAIKTALLERDRLTGHEVKALLRRTWAS